MKQLVFFVAFYFLGGGAFAQGQFTDPLAILGESVLPYHYNNSHGIDKVNARFTVDSIIYTEGSGGQDQVMRRFLFSYDDNQHKRGLRAFERIDGAWDMTEQRTFIHNEQGFLKTSIYNDPDQIGSSNSVWRSRTDYTYEGQRLRDYVTSLWDSDLSDWEPFTQNTFEYNPDGQVVREIEYGWQTDFWEPSRSEENEYDSHGRLIRVSSFTYDRDAMQYIPSARQEFTYNERGNQLTNISYFYDQDTDSWVISERYLFVYNAEGVATEGLYEFYSNGTLFFGNRSEMTFDGVTFTTVNFSYDFSVQAWSMSTKIVITYGNTERLFPLQTREYYWDGNDWVLGFRSENVIDDDGYVIRTNSFDCGQKDCELFEFEEYTYYPQVEYSDLVQGAREFFMYPFVESFDELEVEEDEFIGSLILLRSPNVMRQLFHSEGNNSAYNYYDIYISGESVTSNDFLPDRSQFNIYPNPASRTIHIASDFSLEQTVIELFDPSGKKIFTQVAAGNRPLALPPLPTGVYFFRVSSDSRVLKSIPLVIKQ